MAARWEDANWRKEMGLRLDFSNMMTDNIGAEHGITPEEIDALTELAGEIAAKLDAQERQSQDSFMRLPYDDETASEIKRYVESIEGRFENFVVLGIGGSALGNITLHNGLNHPYHNLLPRAERRGAPRVFVLDNVDPQRFAGLLDTLDVEQTLFNVITKSGGTVETLSNFMAIRQELIRKVGRPRHSEHIVATTDPEKGSLRKIAREEGYKTFAVPPGVQGRYSILSSVGLLSTAVSGIDIDELLAGARHMDAICRNPALRENPAFLNAALQFLAYQTGKHISVLMPYVHALRGIADWYVQIWAESLGKKLSLDGQVVQTGPTPIRALGATDQHSQLQLYTEGPFDKVMTFIGVDRYGTQVEIPRHFTEEQAIGYLGGHTLEELLKAEQKATELALKKANRMNCTITLPEVNPFTVGQLLYMLEVQTAFSGGLYDINPFDQPGVEAGKNYACAMMGRPGYEQYQEEMESEASRKRPYALP